MARQGHRAVMFYLVNRTDCTNFKLADDVDPNYAKECAKAQDAGVEILVYRTDIRPEGIVIEAHLIAKP